MVIGYARTSTQDQNQDLQTDALKKAGSEKIFTDKISWTVSEKNNFAEETYLLFADSTF